MVRVLLLLLAVWIPSQAWAGFTEGQVPEKLSAWIPWVLEGEDNRACPFPSGGGERLCAWPGRLHLELDDVGGLFGQRWKLYARSWVYLPGGPANWPQDVRVGETPVAVVDRNSVPAVELEPGEYALSGRLLWDRLPEVLTLSPETALVSLRVNGETIALPRIDDTRRLWLAPGEAEAGGGVRDALHLEVYRRIEDDIPLRLVTRLDLKVAGRARELLLGPVPLAGDIPMRLQSSLPARLEPDGRLRVQVRPGRWSLEVTSHRPERVTELSMPRLAAPWPEEEVWVFRAHPELRQVEPGAADAVDPRQTGLPPEWTHLPAFLMRPGETLRLGEISRGDADPAPDRLSLKRDLWLDFDGGGFTVRDRIEGELSRGRRAEVDDPMRLGRIEENSEARFITRRDGGDRDGVEVRPGPLRLVAESRIEEGLRTLPVSGWSLDLREIETTLHLPPGWDLLAVSGVDNLPDTWLNRWTLLDLFLVLLLAVGSWRLWGPLWGLLALIGMVLIWQVPGAPGLIWLNLLGVLALRSVIPAAPERTGLRRLRWLVSAYYRASLLVLAVIALPFLVEQARSGLYPQLDRPGYASLRVVEHDADALPRPMPPPARTVSGAKGALLDKIASTGETPPPRLLPRVDPNAQVQTGPGVPDWRWTDFDLQWRGPVDGDHALRLWLLSPGWHLALSAARIALVLALGLKMAGLLGGSVRKKGVVAGVLLAAGLLGVSGQASANGFPSPELLEELRSRLLEPPDCTPACADVPRMELRAAGQTLTLHLEVHVARAAAVPLPGGGAWSPSHARLGDEPLDGLRRARDGTYLAELPAGVWRVVLSGPLPSRAAVEIPLPLRPHRVVVRADGFRVEGVDANGRPGSQIQVVRLRANSKAEEFRASELPPLVRVSRRLQLGVDWRIETRVRRLSEPRFPVMLEVPLVPGEQVLDEEASVRDGRLAVSLFPGEDETGWSSSLEPVDRIVLRAGQDPRLNEEWRVDVGPQWHLEREGIPPMHHQGELEDWVPTWRPWPGEEVVLRLARPQGVPGPTLSLLRSEYRLEPGRRTTSASLELTLRSSRGGRHRIDLPEGAELEEVRIDGKERPLRLEGEGLILPLVPDTQQVLIRWRQPDPIGLSYAPARPDLGLPGVNANLQVVLGPERWVLLTGGPTLGPAVLFWALLAVLVLLAAGLGRSRLTPLRSWDWLLLGLGLSQAGVWMGLLVVGWLFALGLRARLKRDLTAWRFNLLQSGLVILTLIGLAALVSAVQQGLLGQPQMQIAGNGSSATLLNWYEDRSDPDLPRVWVVSVPILVYRFLMLAWALWLTLRLIGWLRWGWQGLASPVLWREVNLRLSNLAGRRRRGSGEGP